METALIILVLLILSIVCLRCIGVLCEGLYTVIYFWKDKQTEDFYVGLTSILLSCLFICLLVWGMVIVGGKL